MEFLRIIAAALAVLLAAWGIGRAVWRWRPASETLAIASGTAVLSLALFAMLVLGWYRLPVIAAVLATGILIGGWRRPSRRSLRAPWWIWAACAVIGVFYFINAAAPEIQPDATGYHLGLPAEWLRAHGFTPRAGFYEVLPLGLETVFGAAMALGGASAAKLFHFALLVACFPLCARIAAQLSLPRTAGLAGVALFALSPLAGVAGTSAYNDVALVFFHLALFSLLLDALDGATPAAAVHAGLAAGFCYALKLTGLLPIAAGFAVLAGARRWRLSAGFFCAAATIVAPWMVRAFLITGNPLAPVANGIFDNDVFSPVMEADLASNLRDLSGLAWSAIPRALAIGGEELQGLAGPWLLLTPLSLLALRKRAGRWLLGAAAVAGIPWFFNHGARFLLPALPFLGIALAVSLPARILPGVLLLHAALGLPAAMDRYTDRYAWRLRDWPWRAALRIEPEREYLSKKIAEYSYARMVAEHVPAGEDVLDLFGLATLYTGHAVMGPQPTVPIEQMITTLNNAVHGGRVRFHAQTSAWPERFFRALRLRAKKPSVAAFVIAEIRLFHRGREVPVSSRWFIDAWPSPQHAARALDGRLITSWQTPGGAEEGSFVEIRFDRPAPLDGYELVAQNLIRKGVDVEVYGQGIDHRWQLLPDAPAPFPTPIRSYRREAAQFLKSRGIRWLFVLSAGAGTEMIGRDLIDNAWAWDAEVVARIDPAALIRLR